MTYLNTSTDLVDFKTLSCDQREFGPINGFSEYGYGDIEGEGFGFGNGFGTGYRYGNRYGSGVGIGCGYVDGNGYGDGFGKDGDS
jgi:hypothetical protein